eukprot:CAMPEP_0178409572 /NCGR_PEP_ID=MMETSP0689_2-20121128/20532_1 /TAXON_ID=160604 /ORGANISM="Amphidinium massartii, Strain CS-259" /LENGTH=652 /DNA_ID=CAMNT_0020030719 /DNA_START=14 /DNA_END=1968 /DNA_ORIENTATION=-
MVRPVQTQHHKHQPRRRFRVSTTSCDVDAVESYEKRDLLLQLAEARAEVQQLRNALRCTAGQEPPMLQLDTFYHDMIAKLETRLHERDEQLRQLRRGATVSVRQALHNRHNILAALQRWSGHNILDVAREAFGAWSSIILERRSAAKLKAAWKDGASTNDVHVRKVLQTLSGGNSRLEVKVILAAWHAASSQTKLEAERQTMQHRQRQAAVLAMSGRTDRATAAMTFVAWRDAIEEQRKSELEQKQHKQHAQAMKQIKQESLRQSILAMAESSRRTEEPMLLKVVVSSWRQCTLDARSTSALVKQRQHFATHLERAKAHATRSVAMMLSSSRLPHLAALFGAWREAVASARLENLRILQTVWVGWKGLQAEAHRTREIERERHEIQLERERHQAAVQHQERQRHAILNSFAASDDRLLLQTLWSAWRADVVEAHRQREQAAQQEAWQQELDEVVRRQLQQSLQRKAALAFEESSEMLLRVHWSCWLQYVEGERRFKQLEHEQRVFEHDVLKEQERLAADKREIEREAAALEARNHELHAKRRALVEFSLQSDERGVLLQAVWSAWREYLQKEEVEELRRLLKRKKGRRGLSSSFACFGRCFRGGSSSRRTAPNRTGLSAAEAFAEALPPPQSASGHVPTTPTNNPTAKQDSP